MNYDSISPENKNEVEDEDKSIDFTLNNNYKIFAQAFILIMLSELGDKSQISTIYLSAQYQPIHVFLSSIIAQYVLSILAVFFGDFISDKVSERSLTISGGIMFLVFAVFTLTAALPELKKSEILNAGLGENKHIIDMIKNNTNSDNASKGLLEKYLSNIRDNDIKSKLLNATKNSML